MSSLPKKSKPLHSSLWVAQALLALLFIGSGLFKLLTPIPTLAQLWSWAGEYPNLLRSTALFDIAGGAGLVLPALTRIRPGLTLGAASGCAALMLAAIGFHFSRDEAANTPINFVVLALTLFVLWGRRVKIPFSS
ncbi:DoxX family protein [Spirosoma sp. KNUC1025]|uniref:DoxX family protein n=1 Tax=Spirosoma sp. KNUC1025 TaxID=2894082 RepID=UPI003868CABC|nr:DoxX family protein [Spirosoma sp. KNUC1025]